MAALIVLDAAVLVAYLDAADEHHHRAERLLAERIDDDFAINPLTLAEVLVVPARENRIEAVRRALDDLDIAELPFPNGAATKLAELRAATGLKMPDCCVLLAVETTNARLATFDDRLRKAAAARNIDVIDS
jgi:predicted nucleic acid-binding protein